MAIEISKEGWVQLFTQMRTPNNFLSRLFTIKPGGLYMGNKVALDIQRFGEQVAVAIKKCTGSNLNDFDEFTTKEFIPPAYGESFPLDACELFNRMAGTDPFTAAYESLQGQVAAKMAQGFTLIDAKINRAIERQAAQILQTGILTLINGAGVTVYTLDFKPKATHFPTTGTAWSAGGADPLADLESLAEVIRADGKIDPNMVIMGSTALRNFKKNADVQAMLDNRRFELGQLLPRFADSGATFQGTVWVGNYEFSIWSYPETFEHEQTGATTKYIDDDKVVMLSDKTRFDKMSSMVPLLVAPDPRVAGLLPGRISSRAEGFDVTGNVWANPEGEQIMGSLKTCTLLAPIQIDGYGCLDTQP